MENIEPKKRTVYELLDTQTVSERKAFVKELHANGINASNVRNWIGKRANIPSHYHPLITRLAKEELTFPKLIHKVFIESEA
ncbi:MAG: hypothetical protein K9H61_02405 [Bacteroidia bacterium]|nr:hypothetical protein [Bacteroidia bacterium]MCF8427178.1 hypothetical protein [Bacteroidia bacterium]MCF8445823.1 hypothetical protein [Bacteroidia bacterium]